MIHALDSISDRSADSKIESRTAAMDLVPPENRPTVHARVVVIGDSTVGKTSLLNRLVSQDFSDHQSPTVVSNFQIKAEDVDGIVVELQIWDTAGQEKFRSLGPIYFRNAAGAICVYDRTSRSSFEHLPQWIDAFTEIAGCQTVIAIAGNKLDLVDGMEIGFPEVKEWANAHNYIAGETSALTGAGVHDLVRELVAAILRAQSSNRLPRMPAEEAAVGKEAEHEEVAKCGC
jgi:small GTP-binding protein